MPTSGSTCWKDAQASHTPLIIISTSTALDVGAHRPGRLGARHQRVEHAQQLGVGGADLVVGQPLVVERLEQRPVGLLAARRTGRCSANSASPGSSALEQRPARGRPTRRIRSTTIAAIRCSLVGKLRNSVPRPTPALLGDLADADLQPALAEHLRRGLDQAPAVALGVGPQRPAGSASIVLLHSRSRRSPCADRCVRPRGHQAATGCRAGLASSRSISRMWRLAQAERQQHGADRRA